MREVRRGDAHRMLTRALHQRAGGPALAEIGPASSESWASATFRGSRHKIALTLSGDTAAERASHLCADVGTVEFTLPGHLVADIAVITRHDVTGGIAIEIEALTVEDA